MIRTVSVRRFVFLFVFFAASTFMYAGDHGSKSDAHDPAHEVSSAHGDSAHAEPSHASAAHSPAPRETLVLPRSADRWFGLTESGEPALVWKRARLGVGEIESIDDWTLMEIVQTLTNAPRTLSETHDRRGVWIEALLGRLRPAHTGHGHSSAHLDSPFDPHLFVWDPGFVQFLDEDGEWTVRLDRRSVRSSDVSTLSPLEIAQAYRQLTGRTYSVELIVDRIDEFRAALSIEPNRHLAEAH